MDLLHFRQVEKELATEEAQAKRELQDASTRELGKLRLELVQDRRITLKLLKRLQHQKVSRRRIQK